MFEAFIQHVKKIMDFNIKAGVLSPDTATATNKNSKNATGGGSGAGL
jgi:hypothetical protein